MQQEINRSIWRIAWPAVLEMAMYMLMGIADVAFVGRLGGAELAGISVGAEIFFAVLLTLNALGAGGSILVAHNTGAGQSREVNRLAAQILSFAFLAGIILSFLGWFLSPVIIKLFAVEPKVASIAVGYMRIAFAFSPLMLCVTMGNGVFRGNGQTRVPMTIAFVANIVHILACYALVFGRLGLPELGAVGTAVALATAHTIAFVLSLYAFASGRWGVKLRFSDLLHISPGAIRRVLSLGTPAAAEEFFRSSSQVVSSILLVHLGTQAFAAHQIAIIVESISYMPGFGFAIAATALVGQLLGADHPSEARKVALKAFRFAILVMGGFAVLFFFLPSWITGLFTDKPDLIKLSALAIQIAAFEQLTIAAEMVFAGALRGAGDTRTPMLVATIGIWGFRLPVLWFLIMRMHVGLTGVWTLFVIDWALRSLIMYIFFRRFDWKRSHSLKTSFAEE